MIILDVSDGLILKAFFIKSNFYKNTRKNSLISLACHDFLKTSFHTTLLNHDF
ncbi:hypothetical protein [Moraxella lacunata]|jgi:hypothetical protein|uniref:hypothetical protein n=1 Tax=Moraxella lacunata TaxID=477 RepID=UPI000B0FED9B